MKKHLILSLALLALASSAFAQSYGISPSGSITLTRTFVPPVFKVNGDLKFVDANGNHAIDASEACSVQLSVTNIGKGDGQGLSGSMTVDGADDGISYRRHIAVDNIPAGKSATITFPLETDLNTADGEAKITVQLVEPHKLGTRPMSLTVATRKFDPPLVKYVDYKVTCDAASIAPGVPFTLEVMVQNVGYSDAHNVNVNIILPENITSFGGNVSQFFSSLPSGDGKIVKCQLIANQDYSQTSIPIQVKVHEKYGKYAEDGAFEIPLNQPIAQRELVVAAVEKRREEIQEASFRSDVDRDIPHTTRKDDKTFVLIVANQQYQSEQPISTAVADANSIRDYCTSTLGIPSSNIEMHVNRTVKQMQTDVSSFATTIGLNPGCRFLFFYFGHGMASSDQQDAYLLAVDGSSRQPDLASEGISRQWMLRQFEQARPSQMVVYLESCFSGATPTDQMLAYADRTSGVRLEDKVSDFGGNILLLSACSNKQTANAYPAGLHNLFTYCFLKQLQQSRGDITWGELFDSAAALTQKKAHMELEHKLQTPTYRTSQNLPDAVWRKWKVLQ